jgi:hypothetical protein
MLCKFVQYSPAAWFNGCQRSAAAYPMVHQPSLIASLLLFKEYIPLSNLVYIDLGIQLAKIILSKDILLIG